MLWIEFFKKYWQRWESESVADLNRCIKCKHLTTQDTEYPCNVCVHRVDTEDLYAPQTNADRIRAMSDEELAEWLTKITNDAQIDARTKMDYRWGEWLKEEVKE